MLTNPYKRLSGFVSVAGIRGNGLLGAIYTGDLNSLIEAGVYQISTVTTSKPTGLEDGIIVMLSNSKQRSIAVQLAFGSGGKMFYRYKWLSAWSTWNLATSTSL